jgi:muconolactone delta-isomerase
LASKFLVLWRLDVSRAGTALAEAVVRQQDHAKQLVAEGKLTARYHMLGQHGGAWIYFVDSNEELDRLLAMAPVYNFATYEVIALAEMVDVPVLPT